MIFELNTSQEFHGKNKEKGLLVKYYFTGANT